MMRGATISRCGRYRYDLSRCWNTAGRLCCFVLLNPSTADAERDDPTIRRCIGFARDWGFGQLVVINLFAYRATKPLDLRRFTQPVGRFNGRTLRRWAAAAELVVIAWGQHGIHRSRDQAVLQLLKPFAAKVHCLGKTKNGHPRHPLYVAAKTQLQHWA